MMRAGLTLFVLLFTGLAGCRTGPAASTASMASIGVPKADDPEFFALHEKFLARGKAGPIGVLFLGDSITEYWSEAPDIWERYYGKYQPANFGISGDQTQHVIWRIEHGELDGLAPRVVVFMLGTNNTGDNTSAEIAAADRRIIGLIRAKLPHARILVLGILPRGPRLYPDGMDDPWEQRMEIIRAVNRDLAQLDDGDTIRFLDLGAYFLGPDGAIPDALMPDQLHPNRAGYQVWAEAMAPLLAEMMR